MNDPVQENAKSQLRFAGARTDYKVRQKIYFLLSFLHTYKYMICFMLRLFVVSAINSCLTEYFPKLNDLFIMHPIVFTYLLE